MGQTVWFLNYDKEERGNTMPNVAFFTLLDPDVKQLILDCAPRDWTINTQSLTISDDKKIEILKDADFLLLFPEEISNRVLKSAPNLKLIQLISAGYDLIDINTCNELGIPVANNGGTNAIDVAEYALALILAFYRHIIEQDQHARTGNWEFGTPSLDFYTICGKTAGIIGLGKIGKHVARLLVAFGAKVLYYDLNQLSKEIEQQLGVTYTTLDYLIHKSDIISLHVPITDATRHLIGKHAFSLMKPTTLLVNTCRGEVIDEHELISALHEKRILGAALDVLDKEPPDMDNPIRKMGNVILTPHIAGRTRDTWPRRGHFVFQNMMRVWNSEPPLSLIQG